MENPIDKRWNAGRIRVPRSKGHGEGQGKMKQTRLDAQDIIGLIGIAVASCRIDTDGDDLTIYVERERDGYPIGEMRCISHASLSPVRKLGNDTEVAS